MYTIVASTMREEMTHTQVMHAFHEKVERLLKEGWTPYGDILYYPNGITQAMVFGPMDKEIERAIERAQVLGSRIPKELELRIGGGTLPPPKEHWYD